MPGGNRTTQHHCPQCYAIAKPRCFRREHLVLCEIHATYHTPYAVCPACNEAAKREERVARKNRDAGQASSSSSSSSSSGRNSSSSSSSSGSNSSSSSSSSSKPDKKKPKNKWAKPP